MVSVEGTVIVSVVVESVVVDSVDEVPVASTDKLCRYFAFELDFLFNC